MNKSQLNEAATATGAGRFIEEGEVFRQLGGLEETARPERLDVIVIGGGQAGLSAGYHLMRRGLRFVILDGAARIGDAWRGRWDSLRLFTPAKLDGLDGFPFPVPANAFPTKDQMADYLEAYAARFRLPVRTGTRVERVFRRDGAFVVKAGAVELVADQVIVAMANYQRLRLPAFSAELGPDITQLHSSAYRSPRQLRPGGVLIAGAGNSGAEIALELARAGHQVWMSGRTTGEIPFRLDSLVGRLLLARLLLRFVFHRLLTVRTPFGRKMRAKVLTKGTPLIRVKSGELAAAGVKRVPKVAGVRDGRPVLEDGRVLGVPEISNVVWCTGFERGLSFLDLPVFDAAGAPVHESGVVGAAPGLYFVGLNFLHAMSSSMIHGVGRDAARIAKLAAARAA